MARSGCTLHSLSCTHTSKCGLHFVGFSPVLRMKNKEDPLLFNSTPFSLMASLANRLHIDCRGLVQLAWVLPEIFPASRGLALEK